MPAIETEGLTKRFGDEVVAVEDLDLTVAEGEVFGFLGPNGAGKSTTIDLLLDFVRPTAGSARVFGLDAQAESTAVRERVGVLPEGYGFDGHLTATEYVEWTIESKAADDDPGRVLERVGLADDADRRIGGFSKGMRQRLAFGMALVGDPDLLILDEPTSGLDPNGIQAIRETVRSLADDGTTVFFSSHVLSEVEAVCDRVGVMNDGRLVATDSIEGLRERAGGRSRIELVCASVPSDLALTDLEGVVEAWVEGSSVVARCSDPSAKLEVIKHVAQRTTVRDVLSSNASLEDLFNRLTEGGRDAAAGESGPTGSVADGSNADGSAADRTSAETDDDGASPEVQR